MGSIEKLENSFKNLIEQIRADAITTLQLDRQTLRINKKKEKKRGLQKHTRTSRKIENMANIVKLHFGMLSSLLKESVKVTTVAVDPSILSMLDETSWCEFFHAVGNVTNLSAFEICSQNEFGSKIEVSWLTKTLQQSMNLKSLRLCNIELLGTKQEFAQFDDALFILSCSTLKKIIVQETLIPTKYYNLDRLIGSGLSKIPAMSTLEDVMIVHDKLDQQYVDVSAETIQSLCKIPTMKRLSLNGFQFDPENIAGIAHALAKPNSTLEYLNLSCNALQDCDFLIISYALELSSRNRTSKLRGLNLADNQLGCQAGEALGAVLAVNSTLTLLNLSCNDIGNVGGVAIAKVLFVNDSLKKLYLKNCSLGDDVLKSTVASFHYNSKLEQLNIENNNPTEKSISYNLTRQ